jgi:cytochrome c oxidase subunit I
MIPLDGSLPATALYPGAVRNGVATVQRRGQALSPGLIPAAMRRLLAGWLGLAVGSLVVAGLFAAVAAFARTPVVYRLFSAGAFQLALVGHVTFAFTVWFVAFSGALWVYVAWRANFPLSLRWSWAGLGVAVAGTALLAIPAFTGVGKPYLSDYVPAIDHPLFWMGLTLTGVGVGVQAVAYLVAYGRGRRPAPPAGGSRGTDVPEALAMAVGALALLLALGVTALSLGRLHDEVPFGYRLRALFWGPGHLLQFLHVSGTVAAWLVAAAVAVGIAPPSRRIVRACVWGFLPFLIVTAALYLAYAPEALLTNHLVTIGTFWGVGAGAVPVGLMLASAWRRRGSLRRLPWGSPVFSGTALSLALFSIGGVLGVVGFNQDTRVPAHYHGMVGAVTLAYMGLAPLLLEISGRRVWSARVARWQPYLYGLGLLGIMAGMHWAGGHGAPRKTFGFTWADAQALIAMNLMGVGSLLAILGGLAFVLNVGIPLGRRGR